jgi:hypothetical protein
MAWATPSSNRSQWRFAGHEEELLPVRRPELGEVLGHARRDRAGGGGGRGRRRGPPPAPLLGEELGEERRGQVALADEQLAEARPAPRLVGRAPEQRLELARGEQPALDREGADPAPLLRPRPGDRHDHLRAAP